jgi:hypothetical protein
MLSAVCADLSDVYWPKQPMLVARVCFLAHSCVQPTALWLPEQSALNHATRCAAAADADAAHIPPSAQPAGMLPTRMGR